MDRDDAIRLLTTDPSVTGVFSDFDGTLSDIVPRPEDAAPVDGAVDIFEALATAFAHVAVISGRSLEDLRSRFRPHGVVLAGSYGRERSDRPHRRRTEGWEAVTIAAAANAERIPGVVLERKGTGVAFHYRAVPDREDEVRHIAADLAETFELEVRPGRLVVELIAPGPGKGDALAKLAAEHGLRTLLFGGDDVADLEAFEHARTLDLTAVLVGVTSDESPDELTETADFVVRGPHEFVDLLRELTPLR